MPAPKRQCWTCKKRRLVCDGDLPTCTRCLDANLTCLGYSKQKPLRFLEPGVVKTRQGPPRKPVKNAQSVQSVPPVSSPNVPGRPIDQNAIQTKELRVWEDDLLDSARLRRIRIWRALAGTYIGKGIERDYAADLPSRPAPVMLAQCRLLQSLLQLQHEPTIPSRQRPLLRTKFLTEKQRAVEMVNMKIDKPESRFSGETATAIMYLAFVENFYYIDTEWKLHVAAVFDIAAQYGGWRHWLAADKSVKPYAWGFLITILYANVTTAASEQYHPALFSQLEPLIYELNDPYWSSFNGPWVLKSCLIRINYLRHLGANNHTLDETSITTLLTTIDTFSPSTWVLESSEIEEFPEYWQFDATCQRLAAKTYCLASLSPYSDLTKQELTRQRDSIRAELFDLLDNVPSDKGLKHQVLWPSIVAGYLASNPRERNIVRTRLLEFRPITSALCGDNALLVLEKFWAADGVDWDDCFNRPYVLCFA